MKLLDTNAYGVPTCAQIQHPSTRDDIGIDQFRSGERLETDRHRAEGPSGIRLDRQRKLNRSIRACSKGCRLIETAVARGDEARLSGSLATETRQIDPLERRPAGPNRTQITIDHHGRGPIF